MSETEAAAAIPSKPEITLAKYEAGVLTVRWTGSLDPLGMFEVWVCDGASEVAKAGSGTATTLSLPFDAPPDRRLAAVVGQWPSKIYSLPVPIVTSAPRVTAVAVSSDRILRISWAVPNQPKLTHVQPVLRWDGTELALDPLAPAPNAATLKLPEEVPNTATLALRGLAGVATGPTGSSVALLTTAPTGLAVDYDGTELRAHWDPLPSPLVSGYRVSIVADGSTTALGDTTTASGVWRTDLSDAAAAVVVQALAPCVSGTPSPPVPVFTEALVIGPSFLAPQSGPVLAPKDILLGLPELFEPAPARPLAPLPLGLSLTRCESGPYTYELRIPASSPVWRFEGRGDVVAEWVKLLAVLEPVGLTPYGAAALTEAVSRSMPQTFDETLYFAYGLRLDDGCFDLRPGMVLRVESESYQVAPSDTNLQPATALSGFVTSGVADYEIASCRRFGRWSNSPDAFLAVLTQQAVGVLTPGAVGSGYFGGGGMLDLFAKNVQLPYLRVVYPKQVLETHSPGSVLPTKNALVLAGASLAALERATKAVRAGEKLEGVGSAYFRGRATLRVLIRISVDGQARLVPLGTTLGNVLAAAGRRPPAVELPLHGVALRRARSAAAVPGAPARDWPVIPGWRPYHPAAVDLPLLHGDRVSLTTAGADE